jgi:hypothetical protein
MKENEMGGECSLMKELRNASTILVGMPEGKS